MPKISYVCKNPNSDTVLHGMFRCWTAQWRSPQLCFSVYSLLNRNYNKKTPFTLFYYVTKALMRLLKLYQRSPCAALGHTTWQASRTRMVEQAFQQADFFLLAINIPCQPTTNASLEPSSQKADTATGCNSNFSRSHFTPISPLKNN